MFSLREYQQQAVDDIISHMKDNHKPSIAVLPTGCHEKGYQLLKANGDLILVEDIKVGDKIMGPNGIPKKVLNLFRGIEQMYEITLRNGISFTVNEGHILQLYRTGKSPINKGNYDKTYPPVVSVTVKEYINWAKSRKHLYKIKRGGDLNYKSMHPLPIDPYFLGLWLGDGDSGSVGITTMDKEIKQYCYNIAKLYNLKVRVNQNSNKTCPTYYLTKGRGKGVERPLFSKFKDLNLLNNKHIPDVYQKSSTKNRLSILEGLIDSDGTLDKKRGRYEIALSNKSLALDVYRLCCGLGLSPTMVPKKTKYKKSYKISFRWDQKIQPRIKRKRSESIVFRTDVSKYSFKINASYIGEYYGFELSGDNLYIDTHNIIHHNSGKSLVITELIRQLGDPPTLVLQPSKELLEQNYDKFITQGGKASLYSASVGSKEVGEITYATPGSVKNSHEEFEHIKLVVLDECFPYKTPIATDKGSMYIGDIHNEIQNGNSINVKTYNEDTKKFEVKKVKASKNNGIKPLVNINLGKTSVKCTENHKILTTIGWVKAKDLKKGDAVMTSYNHSNISTYSQLSDDQFDLLIGSSLGDGYLNFRNDYRHIGRISMIQGNKQYEYIKYKAELLNCKDKIEYLEENGYCSKPAYRFNSPVLFLGDKFINYSKQIDQLNAKSLAILWQDDGHLYNLQNGGSLYALCESEVLVNKLNSKIKKLGVDGGIVSLTKSSSTGKDIWYIRFKKHSIQQLSELISPYVHPSMSYKIIDSEKNRVGSYTWDNTYKPSVRIVKNVEYTHKYEEVFDIEVEDNHNFIVTTNSAHRELNGLHTNKKGYTNDGIIVHNCHLGTGSDSMIAKFIGNLSKSVKVIGLTATPIKLKTYSDYTGGPNFSQLNILTRIRPRFFSTICHVTQVGDLYDQDYLTPLRFTSYNFDRSALKVRGSDFDDNSASKALQEQGMLKFAVDLIKEALRRGKDKILVFTPTVADSYYLQERVPGLEVVSSKTKKKDRTRIVQNFKQGRVKVVSNYGTLTTGFDAPELDLIIMARPTQSYALYYQMLGRGIRIAPGKKVCDVVDLSGNYKIFGDIKDLVIEDHESYGWGMFVKDHLISGIPIGQKLHKDNLDVRNQTVTFGKYKGVKYKDVPTGYWEWIAEKFDLSTSFSKKNVVPILKALNIDYKKG